MYYKIKYLHVLDILLKINHMKTHKGLKTIVTIMTDLSYRITLSKDLLLNDQFPEDSKKLVNVIKNQSK